jgi:hypothetical protein
MAKNLSLLIILLTAAFLSQAIACQKVPPTLHEVSPVPAGSR